MPTQILAARWILPICRPPIQGGWVRIENQQVIEIGRGRIPKDVPEDRMLDLGEAALLPGLVNAHTHLEFSHRNEPIGEPGMALYDWIGRVVESRIDFAPQARQTAVTAGMAELSRSGARLAVDIVTLPVDGPPDRNEPINGLQVISLAEVLGLSDARSEERRQAAAAHLVHDATGGLSPHAPYSTTPQSIEWCIDMACRWSRPLAMHVAESPEEHELLTRGTGPFARALQEMGVWREGVFPWGNHPLKDLIGRLAKAPHGLLIHGNYIGDAEIEQLARHRNLTVVYCPRTHHFFDHRIHPVAKLLSCGVRVALGTDSRASNPDLNLWGEVQHLLTHRTDLAPEAVLTMATLAGAMSLGQPKIGKIEIGSRPGFGYVPLQAQSVPQVYEQLSCRAFIPIGGELPEPNDSA